MQPIQINVQVTIGVSQELNALLLPIAKSLQAAPAPAAEPVKEPVAVEVQPVVENKPAEDPAPVEAAPAEQPAAEAPEKEYTEVDVRAAMDAARKRIEGENYKEKPDSEGYKKWHRVLTAWFKNTAAMFGAEKPSALPDSESRYKFIRCCEEVFVNDAGELDSDCPF